MRTLSTSSSCTTLATIPASPGPTDPESQTTPPSRTLRLRKHFSQPVSGPYTALPLLPNAFATGLLDSASFIAWSTFLSMQTGNTIFLSLGASGQPINNPLAWLKSLTSILAFVLGIFVFSRAQRASTSAGDGATRGRLALSFLAQTVLILIAGTLVQLELVPVPVGLRTPVAANPTDPALMELVPIALLSFQASGQLVASRVLGFLDTPTTVVTTAYCDVVFDRALFRWPNVRRDRMASTIVLLLLGGICGGWLVRSEGRMPAVMWIAAVVKMGVAGMWVFIGRLEEPEREEGEKEDE